MPSSASTHARAHMICAPIESKGTNEDKLLRVLCQQQFGRTSVKLTKHCFYHPPHTLLQVTPLRYSTDCCVVTGQALILSRLDFVCACNSARAFIRSHCARVGVWERRAPGLGMRLRLDDAEHNCPHLLIARHELCTLMCNTMQCATVAIM
jgi:hypothetical protein